MPIPDVCVGILNVSNEDGISTRDTTVGETLILESGYMDKKYVEEANRRGNQVLKASSIGMGSQEVEPKNGKTCSIKSKWRDI